MIHNRTIRHWVATACLIGGSAVAYAEPASPRDEIQATVDAVNAAVMGGISPAGLAEMLFAPDVVGVGEGESDATRGMAANTKAVEEHWAGMGPDGQKKCTLALTEDAGVSSPDTYASFFTLHCEPNPPVVTETSDIRGIYVWKKLPQGWRVALEIWGVGKL